jgi:hypothetical protein
MQYLDWNRILCDYFSRRAAPGSLVYLAVNDELLEALGAANGVSGGNGVTDFTKAVREHISPPLGSPDEVALAWVRGEDCDGRPLGVAFLAAMVLAAGKMGDEMDEANFFGQLRGLLSCTKETGRLAGMRPAGVEEGIWREWSLYLAGHGLLSSARRGNGSSNRYVNYPISQTLLRHTDREKLRGIFGNHADFRRTLDADLLMSKVNLRRDNLTTRLKEKLRTATGERYAALAEAVADLHAEYRRGLGQAGIAGAQEEQVAPGALIAEVVRQPGITRRGIPAYYELVVKLRPGFAFGNHVADSPHLEINGESIALSPDPINPGVTAPVITLTPKQIIDGGSFPLTGAGQFSRVVLVKRDFRVLFRDASDIYSGIYSTAQKSAVDIDFVFLGKSSLLSDLNQLCELDKIAWQTLRDFGENSGWIEITDGRIIHANWSRLTAADPDLVNALRPRSNITISLSGGIRTQGVYLNVKLPIVTVRGLSKDHPVRLVAVRNMGDDVVWSGEIATDKPLPLPDVANLPGFYRIEVGEDDDMTQRLFAVADFDVLTRSEANDALSDTNPLARMIAAWQEV